MLVDEFRPSLPVEPQQAIRTRGPTAQETFNVSHSVPVSIEPNFTLGALTHYMLLPPTVVTPAPVPSVEMICPELWLPGKLMNKHKLTTTVTHKEMFIAQGGHDCGPYIPDVTIPPANTWYAVMLPFSSRKFAFEASTVQMNGVATACTHLFLPKMTCGEPISAPTALPVTNLFNNVVVGMTLGDLLTGLAKVAASIAFDVLFEKLTLKGGKLKLDGGPLFGKSMKAAMTRTRSSSMKKALKSALGKIREDYGEKFVGLKGLAKANANNLAGFAIDGVRRLSGNEAVDPTLKLQAGNAYLGDERSYSAGSGKVEEKGSLMGQQLGVQRTPGEGDAPATYSRNGSLFGTPIDG